MNDVADQTDDALVALRAIAENPLVAPSKRLEARRGLRIYQAKAEREAANEATIARLRDRLVRGEALDLRQRQMAQDLGLDT